MADQAEYVLDQFRKLYTNHIATTNFDDFNERWEINVADEHGESLTFVMQVGSDDDCWVFTLKDTNITVEFPFEGS